MLNRVEMLDCFGQGLRFKMKQLFTNNSEKTNYLQIYVLFHFRILCFLLLSTATCEYFTSGGDKCDSKLASLYEG